MPKIEWDYSPLITRDVHKYKSIQLGDYVGIVAMCECGELFTAVSSNEKACDIAIKAKYRRHAKRYPDPEIHPNP